MDIWLCIWSMCDYTDNFLFFFLPFLNFLKVNCETDFVARNEAFQKFVSTVAMTTLGHYRKAYEELLEPVKVSILVKSRGWLKFLNFIFRGSQATHCQVLRLNSIHTHHFIHSNFNFNVYGQYFFNMLLVTYCHEAADFFLFLFNHNRYLTWWWNKNRGTSTTRSKFMPEDGTSQ